MTQTITTAMRYTDEQRKAAFKIITQRIQKGEAVRRICDEKGVPDENTFYRWLNKYEDLRELYARAKEIAADALYDEMLTIARTPVEATEVTDGPLGVTIKTADALGHRRLLIDTIKWRLGKERPSKYGDKLDITSGGEHVNMPPIVGMVIKNETPANEDQDEEYDL